MPGYTGAPTLPVSALEEQQLTNAKSQYAVQVMTTPGVNPISPVTKTLSTLYAATSSSSDYSSGDTLRRDMTYTYATQTWVTTWSNVTTGTAISVPASMATLSATTREIVTHFQQSQVDSSGGSPTTKTQTFTADINEPTAVYDSGWVSA